MVNNLYLIVVVLVRLLAVGCILGALYAFAGSLTLSIALGGGQGGLTWLPLTFAAVSGVVLWLAARPIGVLVTSNLSD